MNSVPEEERCLHFDICGLKGPYKPSGKQFCILHYPEINKNVNEFNEAIKAHLQAGHADFRYVHFHKDATPPFLAVPFPDLADFRNAVFPTELQLGRCRFPKGLILATGQLGRLDLTEAIVDGPVQIEVEKITTEGIILRRARIGGQLLIKAKVVPSIDLRDATVDGSIDLQIEDIKLVSLINGKLSHGITLASTARQQISLQFNSAEIGGPVDIKAHALNTSAAQAKFFGQVKIESHDPQEVNFGWAELNELVVLRPAARVNFSMATIRKGIDVQHCTVDSPNFEGTKYDAASKLDLKHSIVRGDLRIIGSPTGPKTVDLDSCRIEGSTTIETRLGAQPIEVLARSWYPQFNRDVALINVDVSSCKLVGSALHQFGLTNVKWNKRYGRCVLYDEVAMRSGDKIPYGNLKEAYQLLKEKYRQVGDNARAGDFHYGEMEMRRWEYGKWKRFFCLEFIYWALSGYGIGYIRASIVLCLVVLAFAWLYLALDRDVFSGDYLQALLYSMQVSTLQRPPTPDGLSVAGRWLQSLQAILAPVQIALFGLALRMRLKR